MGKVSITLDADALLELHEVLLDEDQAGALDFLKKHIAPRIPRKGTAPCDSSRLNPFLLRGGSGPPSAT
jgi:hypothetical protein